MADPKTQIIISAKDETLQAFNSVKSNLTSINGIVGGLTSSFAGLAGAGGIVGLLGKISTETKQAANEQAQLAAVLKSTGGSAGFAQEELNKLATQLSRVSIFSEGDITNAETRLLSYTGVVGKQFPRAMQAVVDMSARMGYSLEQSAETIGRALDIPSQGLTALTKQGFRFTEAQKELVKALEDSGRASEAQDIILKALETSYGGAAEAARGAFGGALENLSNQFDDMFELKDDGKAFASVINDLAIAMEAFNSAASNTPFDTFDRMLPGYKKFRTAMDADAESRAVDAPLILPKDSRIDAAQAKIFDMPMMMKDLPVTQDLLGRIKKDAEDFRQNNPLTDVIAKQQEYRKELEKVNKLEREGGLTAKEAARYRQQLADGLNKGVGKKETDAAAKFVEQLGKQAEVLGLSKTELLEYEAANQKLSASQKATVDGLIGQISAFEQLEKATRAWADQAGLNADSDNRELALLEEQAAAEQDAMREREEAFSDFYNNLVTGNEDLNVRLITSDKKRAQAQLELENARAIARIDALGLEADQAQILLDLQTEQFELQMQDLVQSGTDGFDELTRAVEGFGRDSATAIADFAFGAEMSVGNMVESMLKDLARMTIYENITKPLFSAVSDSLGGGGGFGDFFGDLFGGARASGGPVSSGKAYLVGENGPELFAPGMSGTIIPNDFGGGGDSHISVSVDARGNGNASTDADAKRIGDMVAAAVRAEMINQKRSRGLLT